ncbi:MAG: hypothetical protein H6558_02975 [Lewinellaceae bacterium]|nr:hypothetical protein [Lewinellaceae bacterium]
MTRHGYSWFHDWLLGKLRKSGGTPILKFLDELDEEGYPYDLVQLRYTLVRQWRPGYGYAGLRPRMERKVRLSQIEDRHYNRNVPGF